MSTFALEKWYQDSKCTIYSVRDDLDDVDSFTEADRFFEKFGKTELSSVIVPSNGSEVRTFSECKITKTPPKIGG